MLKRETVGCGELTGRCVMEKRPRIRVGLQGNRFFPEKIGIFPCCSHVNSLYLRQEKKKGLGYDNDTDDTRRMPGRTDSLTDVSDTTEGE